MDLSNKTIDFDSADLFDFVDFIGGGFPIVDPVCPVANKNQSDSEEMNGSRSIKSKLLEISAAVYIQQSQRDHNFQHLQISKRRKQCCFLILQRSVGCRFLTRDLWIEDSDIFVPKSACGALVKSALCRTQGQWVDHALKAHQAIHGSGEHLASRRKRSSGRKTLVGKKKVRFNASHEGVVKDLTTKTEEVTGKTMRPVIRMLRESGDEQPVVDSTVNEGLEDDQALVDATSETGGHQPGIEVSDAAYLRLPHERPARHGLLSVAAPLGLWNAFDGSSQLAIDQCIRSSVQGWKLEEMGDCRCRVVIGEVTSTEATCQKEKPMMLSDVQRRKSGGKADVGSANGSYKDVFGKDWLVEVSQRIVVDVLAADCRMVGKRICPLSTKSEYYVIQLVHTCFKMELSWEQIRLPLMRDLLIGESVNDTACYAEFVHEYVANLFLGQLHIRPSDRMSDFAQEKLGIMFMLSGFT
ncbi:hypothetical protein KIN20_019449 [Parelaphostrongylus tenuis]|uniref:Uncharacterized protein n=1 Tax=Parelaphostrongylus tenuis TaxID=148309 RepID=A0AAD5MRK7_PARTN|nr:hypothetical protein KIN20_019449 [Parelaphostrongylus tenuis]